MNCIITLKINDYYPKLDSIPYENFICIITNNDFKQTLSLSKNNNNKCTQEIPIINTDIKYTIHILESNSNSLIGISELLIPLFKFKQINPPCTIIHEQKLKIIMDMTTKRKLFKTLINASDIFLNLIAEIYVPNIKNIGNIYLSIIEVKRKNKNNNKENINKKKKKIIKSNNNNNINKTISYDNKNNNNKISNKIQLLNDIKDSFKKIDEINLSNSKSGIKKSKINQKRSPKKRVTILELIEQKMQPLLLNNNLNEEKNININIKLNKSGKKLISPKSKKENKKYIIKSFEKHSSKKCMTSKNSNENTASTNRLKKASAKCLNNNKINLLQNNDIKIDINRNLYDNINKLKEFSYLENDEINSNYGILSTDERTEQILSEIDKIILEKSSKLREIFYEQINIINNHKKISGTLYMKDKENINKEINSNDSNKSINKSSIESIYNNSNIFISQENVKNNYLSLIDLYHLLDQKLSKIISENIFSFKKLNLLKEELNYDNKRINIIKRLKSNLSNKNNNLKNIIDEKIIYTKNLESKIYQNIFDININAYEIIRQKEIERINKLNEGRKLNILIKLIKNNIYNIGNISQIFKGDKYKQNFLKFILEKNNIQEKEEESENYNINKYKYYSNENFENKIIKEVDEEKEEESDYYSSVKKKNRDLISKNILDEIKNNSNNINNIINDNNNKNIDKIKEILDNKYKEIKKFIYINNNEFLFDNKFKIKASLSDNNEIIIEYENNKYDIDSFISKYNKEENNNSNNDNDNLNKKVKSTFIYTKKIMAQNQHQTRRRKKRINEDSEEEN